MAPESAKTTSSLIQSAILIKDLLKVVSVAIQSVYRSGVARARAGTGSLEMWSEKVSIEYTDIINFWFTEIDPKLWFKKDQEFDQLIRDRYGNLHHLATQAELFSWRTSPEGRLAEVIVLDQFSRNLYRDSPVAFASDPLALVLAQETVSLGLDLQLEPEKRTFLYMPYMHSESLLIHDQAVRLFTALGRESNLDYENRHRAIIEKFGRYPHRNKVLGRQSTVPEYEFLTQPGSSF